MCVFFRTDVTSAKDIGLCVGMLSPLQLLVYSSFRRLSNYCNVPNTNHTLTGKCRSK